MPSKKECVFRCIDFQASDFRHDNFKISMYGIDEERNTYCVRIDDFKPFMYIKVGNSWTEKTVEEFIEFLKNDCEDPMISQIFDEYVTSYKLVKHKTLYDFDANKYYKFIYISCENLKPIYKLKSLYYDKERQRVNKGLLFNGTYTKIYETMIPPLLRFFHIQNISPSGWVKIDKCAMVPKKYKQTSCTYEIKCKYNNVISLIEKETVVPYKICSFDIEASSSHGDFPTAIKNYKKVAYDIVDYMVRNDINVKDEKIVENTLRDTLENIFGFEENLNMDNCFLKIDEYDYDNFELQFKKMIKQNIVLEDDVQELENSIESYFSKNQEETNDIFLDNDTNNMIEEDNVHNNNYKKKQTKKKDINSCTIIEVFNNNVFSNQAKTAYLMQVLDKNFPPIEGDYVTFIGSTFVTHGQETTYLNNCICLEDTENIEKDTQEIEVYNTEKEVLVAWSKLIQREDPDIIIGYNIFGFDYPFMFDRAKENNCIPEFMKLSRNNKNPQTELTETSIVLASGAYNLRYPLMEGRLQIDVFTYMRKEFILPSYKLDYVSSYLISDGVKSYENNEEHNTCYVYTKNMKGITMNCFVHFEIINHSNDYYENGKKFKVIEINKDGFVIDGHLHGIEKEKVQWGLAKDDVTPQDIFRMTNEGPHEKGIIAKYCIQDCNLVHQIFQKIDIMTTYIEMSKICSVPISFLMMRGQGIKLTSYIAKKCREKDTLMPLISKGNPSDMYEGAIVLEPKCNLYLDNPVACVDYSSLYPSSIISENISHDSKVWTKEYDLNNNLIKKTGIQDDDGGFKYDNLPGYKYVDIKYDTFGFKRDSPTSKAKKVLTGYKVCRFAQFPDGEKAIMPSILHELLAARKATKKQMAKETDPFMKNILDKRQLSIKVTANSLYGQTGAKTSTFYEMDVAASTTATGRKLLIYAREIIENVYANMNIDTKYGPMLTNAEYVYGDSVANYTPIHIMKDNKHDILQIDNIVKKYTNEIWKNCIEAGKQDKEYVDLTKYDIMTWTDKGWTKLNTIIRHKLASHKKMKRILTHTGCVDVTDDHSLLKESGDEISPNECEVGTELMHHKVEFQEYSTTICENKARLLGFFFGDGSCGNYSCKSGPKSSWALNNQSIEIIQKYKYICENLYPDYEWKVYDTLSSSGVYKLTFNTKKYGENAKFIEKYRKTMYNENHKIIPNEILTGSNEIKSAFLEGLYDADGDKQSGSFRIDQKSQISASHIFNLVQSLGYNVSINTRDDKPDIYRINFSMNSYRKSEVKIKKIIELPHYDDYVYDLTTENHHFAAGIGNMIVHNTDSVFFTFNLKDAKTQEPVTGQKALEVTIEMAKEAGEVATKFLKKPHDLEYEKTFLPFCLLSKKRYVGMLYEEDPHKCKRKSMGIVLKRRDNAPIVKDVYGGIIDILMKEQDINKSIDFLDTMLRNIVDEKIGMDKLIISKSLRSFYKNPQQIAHKVLADRMGVRDPGNKPGPGDRIPYVYILTKVKKDLQGNKIENPDYIKQKKLKIDYGFYISNQIMKPVLQIYSLVLYNMPQFRRKKQGFINKLKTLKSNAEDMEKYYKKEQQLKDKEVEKLLFEKYLIINKNKANNNTMITGFFKKKD